MELDRLTRPLVVVLRLAFAAVVFAALVVDMWLMRRTGPGAGAWAIVGVAVCGWLWARRPAALVPLAAVAAALSLYATVRFTEYDLRFPLFTEYVVLPTMFAGLLHRWRPWPGVLAGAVAFSALVVSTRAGAVPIARVMAAAALVLLGAGAAAVIYNRVRDSERRTSIERARAHERLELARELHDVVGHHVTGIVVLAQARRFTAAAAGGDPVHDQTLAEIEQAGLETMTSIRRLVGLLRADPSTSSGPEPADLERIVDDLRRTHPGARFDLDVDLRSRWLPAELAVTVHRLVHEAATNVRKYGDPARPVLVSLRRRDRDVELRVENGIQGAGRSPGYGLVGMRERVEALGGTFVAGDDEAGSWVVRAVIPLAADDR